jgi:hypothetical protein
METERVTTTLRFVGDWPWWLGVSGAVVLAAVAFVLYRRDVRALGAAIRWSLPALRAAAVAMLVLMLSGPVLHHRKILGELSVLQLYVDGSASMSLADPMMSDARKILVAQRLGLLANDPPGMELAHAANALAEAQSIATRARSDTVHTAEDWKNGARDFSGAIGSAREHFAQSGSGDAERQRRFGSELYDPALALAARDTPQVDDRKRAIDELQRIAGIAASWQNEFEKGFHARALEGAGAAGSAAVTALQKFDTLSRAERVEALLFQGQPQPLLARLAANHDLRLFDLRGDEARELWHAGAKDSALPRALPKPDGETTNLASGIEAGAGLLGEKAHAAVVLISDGQHNDGASPVEVAKLFAARQMPVFAIGMGSQTSPPDVAVIKVEAPASVFYQDRVRGEIVLKDDLAAGAKFKVAISDGSNVVWERELAGEARPIRKVPFDFSIKEIVEKRVGSQQSGEVRVAGVPIELQVAIAKAEGDQQPLNNSGALRLRAITQKRKLLIVDGRPRWETRYLRNLFERDEQWEVSAVVAGTKMGEPGLSRGDKDDQFPTEAALLDGFDLIIFGDVPKDLWRADELKWIANFVGQRGGAIAFIDGARRRLQEYADTPLAALFPVDVRPGGISDRLAKFSLTASGQNLAAFQLATDSAQNGDLWERLAVPHWIARATTRPGAVVLLEGVTNGTPQKRWPLVVERSVGAGKVLYHAFDESWRWRYEVGDLHHVRYWNQVANWIAELPFAVRDRFVSLDVGAITYRPHESADLRVRLRDGTGKPVDNAAVDAVLYRDGNKVATIRLDAQDGGGLYRGKTAPLEAGAYEVGVESAAIASRDTRARTQFKVAPDATGELTALTLNEELLKEVANVSGGAYLREEDAPRLFDLLAPLTHGRIIETDTVLWQSYWWFLPVIALLTLEWILRKRAGLL